MCYPLYALAGVLFSVFLISPLSAEPCDPVRGARTVFVELDNGDVRKISIENMVIDTVTGEFGETYVVVLNRISLLVHGLVLRSGPIFGVTHDPECVKILYARWEDGPWANSRRIALAALRAGHEPRLRSWPEEINMRSKRSGRR